MRLIAFALLSVVAPSAWAQDVDCTRWRDAPGSGASTQTGMNICSRRDFKAMDAKLNAVWPKAKARAQAIDDALPEVDRGAWPALLAGQRAWIEYRDSHCLARRYKVYGGSVAPLVANLCLTQLTEERIAQLEDLLREGL